MLNNILHFFCFAITIIKEYKINLHVSSIRCITFFGDPWIIELVYRISYINVGEQNVWLPVNKTSFGTSLSCNYKANAIYTRWYVNKAYNSLLHELNYESRITVPTGPKEGIQS